MFRNHYESANNELKPSKKLVDETKKMMIERLSDIEFGDDSMKREESHYQIDLSKKKSGNIKKTASLIGSIAACFVLIGGAIVYFGSKNNDNDQVGGAATSPTPLVSILQTEKPTDPSAAPSMAPEEPTPFPTQTGIMEETDLSDLDVSTPVKMERKNKEQITGIISKDRQIHTMEYKDGIFYVDKISFNVGDLQEAPRLDYFYVLDFIAEDDYYLFMFESDGPSDDPQTIFLKYEDGQLINLGSIPSYVENMSCDNNGNIKAVYRLDALQTSFAYGTWTLNDNSQLEMKKQDMYEVYQYPESETPLTLKVDLPLYQEANKESAPLTMSPQKVQFVQTDGEHWIQVKGLKDDTIGWLYFSDFNYINALKTEAIDVFDGLIYAD